MASPPVVKAAILALMQAHSWPTSAPEIRWGGPTESEDMPRDGELVYFGDTREMDEEYRALGATRVDEDYTVRIVVDVRLDGDDEQAAETRAWELRDSLCELLHDHHQLIEQPGSLSVELQGRTTNQTSIPLPGAWLARITVDQAVTGLVFNP